MQTHALLAVMVITVVATGCDGAERRCEAANVTTAEAWGAIYDVIGPACSMFDDERFAEVRRSGRRVSAREHLTPDELAGSSIAPCIEHWQPQIVSACPAVLAARSAAESGEVADLGRLLRAARLVDEAVTAMGHLASCAERVTLPSRRDSPLASDRAHPISELVQARAAELTPARMAPLLDRARATSAASAHVCGEATP